MVNRQEPLDLSPFPIYLCDLSELKNKIVYYGRPGMSLCLRLLPFLSDGTRARFLIEMDEELSFWRMLA